MSTPSTAAPCVRASGELSSSCAAARDERNASATDAPAMNTRNETRSMSGCAGVMWFRRPWIAGYDIRGTTRRNTARPEDGPLPRRDQRHHMAPIAGIALEVVIDREH